MANSDIKIRVEVNFTESQLEELRLLAMAGESSRAHDLANYYQRQNEMRKAERDRARELLFEEEQEDARLQKYQDLESRLEQSRYRRDDDARVKMLEQQVKKMQKLLMDQAQRQAPPPIIIHGPFPDGGPFKSPPSAPDPVPVAPAPGKSGVDRRIKA